MERFTMVFVKFGANANARPRLYIAPYDSNLMAGDNVTVETKDRTEELEGQAVIVEMVHPNRYASDEATMKTYLTIAGYKSIDDVPRIKAKIVRTFFRYEDEKEDEE